LFGASAETLATFGIERRVVDCKPGFPCRISLRDAEPGETVLLLNYEHQPANSPYRASHAIFIREHAEQARPAIDEIPDVLSLRLLSVRAFDRAGMMVDADVVAGAELRPVLERLLAMPEVDYLHLHNAKPGCYAARAERA
jgi:hypothetical protein